MLSETTATLVALHGYEDTEEDTLGWAESMLPEGWQLEVPAAGNRSWFDTADRGVVPETFERSRSELRRILASVAARGGPVVLAGFSQGAAMALAIGDSPEVDGVVALCPFLPEMEDLEAASGPPALLLPAAQDEVVPSFLGEDAAALLSSGGREVTVAVLSGGHEPGAEAVARSRAWLQERWPTRMRFTVGLPVDRVSTGAELVSGDAVSELAAAWERVGFDAAFVTDHPAPDDRWLAAGGHHALEPTVALTAAAMSTHTLGLHTHVMVLAYRNPFLAAKAIASLDVMSGGRVILGTAAGYLRPEFEALGVDFEGRGESLDESIRMLRRIWSGESVRPGGESTTSAVSPTRATRSVTALPAPLQKPGPPIWIGGNSARAMRRAVELGDGWSPFPTPAGLDRAARTAAITEVGHLARRIRRLEEMCSEAGRTTRPTVCFSPLSMGDYLADPEGSLAPMVEEVAVLRSLGVDWLALTVPGLSRSEVTARAEALSAAMAAAL